MIATLLLGLLLGWIVTGTVDYFLTVRAARRGYEAGWDDAWKSFSAW